MIEKKELPSEFVSIRQVWLQNINRCCEAISNRAKPDASEISNFEEVGNRTVVYTVDILYYSLVDVGEAIIKSEVKKYYDEKYSKEMKYIWDLWEGKVTVEYVKEKYPDLKTEFDIKLKCEELSKAKLDASKCWYKSATASINLYDFIIQVLYKYGMLFEEQPKGFSNVIMEEVAE